MKEFLDNAERCLRERLSSDAQVFDEHGKRIVIAPVRAVASGDAQWLRSG
jgi:hypothetical protein